MPHSTRASAPYVTIINMPAAPDISRTIQLLLDTTKQLSALAGLDLGSN